MKYNNIDINCEKLYNIQKIKKEVEKMKTNKMCKLNVNTVKFVKTIFDIVFVCGLISAFS